MILKGSQRSNANALAVHLLRLDENDHVEVQELRGFCTDDLAGAFSEIEAVAQGTRCRQPLFSVSFNPPAEADVSTAQFLDAITKVEQITKLEGQPRAIVFHEKDGRRHAHVVWSRIDAQHMRAINLGYYKNQLRRVSQELYITHEWTMPQGMVDGAPKSPLTYSLAEWQEAKRKGVHAGDQRHLIQQCWAASDGKAAFAQALKTRGFHLARGDRRGHVIVTPPGQVIAAARALGKRSKEIKAVLGDAEAYAPVAEVKARVKQDMGQAFARLARSARGQLSRHRVQLDDRKTAMVARHRAEREILRQGQAERWAEESAARQAALKTGLAGLWQWATGARKRLQQRHAQEIMTALARDEAQRADIRRAQLAERLRLETQREAARKAAFGLVRELKAEYREMFRDAETPPRKTRRRRRRQVQEIDPGPVPEP